MPYDPEKHHRRSVRLPDYDYAQAGAYFITVVTLERECLLGKVADGEMALSEYGQIVPAEWLETAIIRPYVMLDVFVVMPSHFHGIIVIADAQPYRELTPGADASQRRGTGAGRGTALPCPNICQGTTMGGGTEGQCASPDPDKAPRKLAADGTQAVAQTVSGAGTGDREGTAPPCPYNYTIKLSCCPSLISRSTIPARRWERPV